MAALVSDGASICRAAQASGERLPAYARPLFLRIKDRIDATATFKQKKESASFDPREAIRIRSRLCAADALYFDDPLSEPAPYRAGSTAPRAL